MPNSDIQNERDRRWSYLVHLLQEGESGPESGGWVVLRDSKDRKYSASIRRAIEGVLELCPVTETFKKVQPSIAMKPYQMGIPTQVIIEALRVDLGEEGRLFDQKGAKRAELELYELANISYQSGRTTFKEGLFKRFSEGRLLRRWRSEIDDLYR